MNAVHDGFPPENATHDEVRFWRSTSCDPFSRTVAKLLDAQPWITVAEISTGTGSTSKLVQHQLDWRPNETIGEDFYAL